MKQYIGRTVRFIRQGAGAVSVQSATLPNFVLCEKCQRYIPRTAYAEHVKEKHEAENDTEKL